MKIKRKVTSFVIAGIISAISCSSISSSAYNMDVNGDGQANIADAVLIMQYLGGAFEPADLTKYDVNSNGVVSDMDAQIIMMYAAGILGVNDYE